MPTPSLGKLAVLPMLMLFAMPIVARSASRVRPTIVEFAVAGQSLRVGVTLDRSLVASKGDHEVKVLGVRGGFALLIDTYQSKPQGLSRCQSGEERYVRLIDLSRRRERYAKLAESCLKNIVPGDPIADWSAGGDAFTIHLLSEPSTTIVLRRSSQVTSISIGQSE